MPAAKMHTLTLILAGGVIATIIQISKLRYMADLCSFALARLNAKGLLIMPTRWGSQSARARLIHMTAVS
jgi:hypothetical protein